MTIQSNASGSLLLPSRKGCRKVSWSFWAAITKTARTGCFINSRNVFLTVVEAVESEIKVPADSVCGGRPSSWFIDAYIFAVSSHVRTGQGSSLGSLS